MTPAIEIPRCQEVEMAVLGAMLLAPLDTCTKVFALIPERGLFYDPRHREIFTAIQTLFGKTAGIDIITVADELRRMEKLEESGGMFYLSQLTSEVVSPAHIEAHCRIILEYALRRDVIYSGDAIAHDAYNLGEDVFLLLDKLGQHVHNLRSSLHRRGVTTLGPEAARVFASLEQARKEGKRGITGIPSGYAMLDNLTAGWQRTNLIILAARPSVGKTALALSMTYNAVHKGIPVGVFSLEMSNEELALRLLCNEAKVDMQKVRTGYAKEDEFNKLAIASRTLADAKLYIDDTPGISLMELRTKAMQMVDEYGVRLIVVDYLQLVTNPAVNESREREIASISRGLKGIAKDLDVPLIALSQLNRNVEMRTGEKSKPMLADLRESGSIEQDADVVLFIHRNKDTDAPPEEKERAEIIVAKQRNGMIGNVFLKWVPYYAGFENLELRFPEEAIPPPVNEEMPF